MSFIRHRFTSPGASPGLSHLHLDHGQEAVLHLIDYNPDELDEVVSPDEKRWSSPIADGHVRWLHVQGKPRPAFLQTLAERFGLHVLALEDVVNVGQRPKFEIFGDWYFIVMQRPLMDASGFRMEQVSIFLGDNCIISLHEGNEDVMEPIRHRLRHGGTGRIRKLGPDYLCYALLDLIVDLGFPMLSDTSDRLLELEEQVLGDPEPELVEAVHQIKRNLIGARRALMPQREVISMLMREDTPLMEERTRLFLRDCHDHMVYILELLESYREMTSGLHDLYLSTLSQKMNEVMSVLTIIATIFIPLSFIVGLYGMNFNTELSPWNMPELNTRYGYPVLWLVLIGISGGMLYIFKRRKWF